jgi:hypothetical protein
MDFQYYQPEPKLTTLFPSWLAPRQSVKVGHHDDEQGFFCSKKVALQGKPLTRIHLIDGERGGVGKSLVARVMIHYFLTRGLPFRAVDTDKSNPDVAAIYSEDCDIANFSENQNKEHESDLILELALSTSVIVNLRSSMFELVNDWIWRTDLIEFCKEYNVQLIKWFVCNGSYSSWQLFKKSLQYFEETELIANAPHILVRNRGLCDDWSGLESRADYQDTITKYNVLFVDFPLLSEMERKEIEASKLTFREALEREIFTILERQRIVTFLKEAMRAFEATEMLQ